MTWPAWFGVDRRRVVRRAIKVALAATVSTAIAKAFALPVPWFATIAAIVAMEVTLRVSVRTGRNLIVGAAAGASMGLGLALVAKDRLWAVGLVVLASYVVFGLLHRDQMARQASLVSTVIVLIPPLTDLSTPHFAAVRFSETVIGIVVALVINATVLPPRAHRSVRRNLGATYEHLAILYRAVIAAEATGERDRALVLEQRRAVRSHLRAIDDEWDEAMAEDPPPEVLAPHWRSTTRRIWEQCTAMDDVLMGRAVRAQLSVACTELSTVSELSADALDAVSAALGGDGPMPDLDELDRAREALLDRVSGLEVHAVDLTFSQALQAFTFVNSVDTIAARLVDLRLDQFDSDTELGV